MEQHLVDLLAWLEPRALLLAIALPPVIRVVGHWIPEEVFMISIGVLAARAQSPVDTVVLLVAVVASHFVADQAVYFVGCWLRPRLHRFKKVAKQLDIVTSRLQSSPRAVYGLIPGRVFPIGRGAWLAGCGVVGIPWRRFAAVDLMALLTHLATWSGLGWWLSGDLSRLASSAEVGKTAGIWAGATLIAVVVAVVLWKNRLRWQPATVQVISRATRPFRTRQS